MRVTNRMITVARITSSCHVSTSRYTPQVVINYSVIGVIYSVLD